MNLVKRPETAAVKFVAWQYLSVVCRTVYIDELLLALTLKDVFDKELRFKRGNTEFFGNLASERISYLFAIVDVSAYGCIPFAGLYLFPQRTLLKI